MFLDRISKACIYFMVALSFCPNMAVSGLETDLHVYSVRYCGDVDTVHLKMSFTMIVSQNLSTVNSELMLL